MDGCSEAGKGEGPSPTRGVHGCHPMSVNYSSGMEETRHIQRLTDFRRYEKTEFVVLGLLTVYTLQADGWWMGWLTWNAVIGRTGWPSATANKSATSTRVIRPITCSTRARAWGRADLGRSARPLDQQPEPGWDSSSSERLRPSPFPAHGTDHLIRVKKKMYVCTSIPHALPRGGERGEGAPANPRSKHWSRHRCPWNGAACWHGT